MNLKSIIAALTAIAATGITAQEPSAPESAESPATEEKFAEISVGDTEPNAAADTDVIDLDELEDSAEAAKKATVVQNGSNQLVDINCDEATLSDILRQFRRTTGANIISGDSTNLNRRVSASLRAIPWQQGLEAILSSRGFRLDERENIFRVVEDERTDPIETRAFQLNHASARELAELFNASYGVKDARGVVTKPVATAFEGANTVVVTATEKTISDCEAIIKGVDKAVAQIYIEARFLELSSDVMHALGMDWSTLKHWGVSARNLRAGFGMSNGRAADYGTRLSTLTQTQTPTANSSTSIDGEGKKTSTSTISSSSSDSSTFTGIVPTKIMEAAGGALSDSEMSWRNSYGFSGQLSASEFSLALSAFESVGEGKIFSNPKIIVSNGKVAKVDMTTKEPNVSVEANYTGTSSQNMSISTKLEVIPGSDKEMFAGEAFFSYGITLTVRPRISPDGLINVDIVPTISEHTGDKEVKGASDQSVYTTYPVIYTKRLTTNFTMKDGATAVIGGLTRTEEQDVDDGIPYLRKIPWIGPRLFGHTSRQKVQKEIIVFVTLGIANPAELPRDLGLPTNAVLGRQYVNGEKQEPGLRKGEVSITPSN